jgi:hypothetical protein
MRGRGVRWASLLAAALLLALDAACGGRTAGAFPAGATPADVATAAAPPGVDPQVWGGLTRALAQALAQRSAAATAGLPPAGPTASVALGYDPDTALLSWPYQFPGDYDQNGVVNISDLTPIAQHFHATNPNGPGQPFPPDSIESVVDGDGNGEINVADITPIAQNWQRAVAGYHLYRSLDSSDYPAAVDGPDGPGAELADSVPLSSATPGGAARRGFSYQLVPTLTPAWYWVRPYAAGAAGAASTLSPKVFINIPPPHQNVPPTAVLAAPAAMATAAHMVWDAGGSADSDGSIVKYEFDFGADGTYDEVHELVDPDGAGGNVPYWTGGGGPGASGEAATGDPALADFWYYTPGSYKCQVRVTDNDGAVAVSPARTLTVSEGEKWRVNELREFATGAPSLPVVLDSLLNVAGLPVINSTTGWWVAKDQFGESWNDPVNPTNGVVNGGSGPFNSPVVIDGRPALLGSLDGPPIQAVYYRALDPYGLSWPAQGKTFVADSTPSATLIEANGRPAVLGQSHIFLGSDVDGSQWTSYAYQGAVTAGPGYIVEIGGCPAFVARSNSTDLLFYRATQPTGIQWSGPYLIDKLELAGGGQSWLEALGAPGVFYFEQSQTVLKYRRATSAVGDSWHDPAYLDYQAKGQQHAVVWDGRPAVIYRDRITGVMEFLVANNAAGTSWSLPATLAVPALQAANADDALFNNTRPWAADIGGHLAIALTEQDAATPSTTDFKEELAIFY